MKKNKKDRLENQLRKYNVEFEKGPNGGYYLYGFKDEEYSIRECWRAIKYLREPYKNNRRQTAKRVQNKKIRQIDVQEPAPIYKPDTWLWD